MSTMLSHSKKFIFIHNYKVAGSSISNVLAQYQPNYWIRTILRKTGVTKYFPALANFDQHASASEVRKLVPEEIFDGYYKFSFVRNPWDWQVSLFSYMCQFRAHFQHDLVKNFTFDEYLDWRIHCDLVLQSKRIADEQGNILMDFVGRFENLEADFSEICEKLGIEMRLPHKNRSNHSSYRKYYTDKSYQLVKEAFEEDIALFNYEF